MEHCRTLPDDTFGKNIVRLGLRQNKHIPQIYLRGSYKQRLALLQGLMDTDGYCSKDGLAEFYSIYKHLALQVQELICSLGMRAKLLCKPLEEMQRASGCYKGKHDMWIVRFTAYDDTPVFSLKRKYDRQGSRSEGRPSQTLNRRIVSIKKVKSFPTKCIAVSGKSNLFLIGREFLPTHNTEMGGNWLGYIIDQTPGPVLVVQPTVEMGKRWSKGRLTPLIEDTPRLQRKVKPSRSRDSGNTVQSKQFDNGVIQIVGSNSGSGLRSMACRYLFADEISAYTGDADGEGDPLALAIQRTATFSRRKIFMASTPTIQSLCRIEHEFELSDKRYYHVPCPNCKEQQKLLWSQIIWDKNKRNSARYKCVHCECLIEEHHKTWMLTNGKWIAEAPGEGKSAGFHLSSLYSPIGWFSWNDAVTQFENAGNDENLLKVWTNTVIGEPWTEKGDAPDWQRLFDRAEDYQIGSVPEGGLLLCAGCDVQVNRIEVEVVAFGKGKRSWSVDYIVLQGDPAKSSVWTALSEVLDRRYLHVNGMEMPITMMAIDSGYATQTVYNWVRKYPHNRVMAVKGVDRYTVPLGLPRQVDVTIGGKKIKRGCRVWTVGVSLLKSELYHWLNLTRDEEEGYPPGYCHFPKYDPEYFKQMTAEQLVSRVVKGYTKREWQKTRDRNEALDCRVYARAASIALGVDRWGDKKWQQLEEQIGIKREQSVGEAISSSPIRRRKNKTRSKFMS